MLNDETCEMISEEGKTFLLGLLERDPKKRLTSEEALQHPWLRKFDDAEHTTHLKSAQDNIKGYMSRKSVTLVRETVVFLNSTDELKNVRKKAYVLGCFI